MRALLTGLCASASLLMLSACASSNRTLSYSAFSTAADKICTTENTQSAADGAATVTATPANAAAITKLVATSETSLAKLRALSGPSALIAARDTFVTDVDATIASVQKAATAARAGNQAAYVAALRQTALGAGQTSADGSKLGATACARA